MKWTKSDYKINNKPRHLIDWKPPTFIYPCDAIELSALRDIRESFTPLPPYRRKSDRATGMEFDAIKNGILVDIDTPIPDGYIAFLENTAEKCTSPETKHSKEGRESAKHWVQRIDTPEGVFKRLTDGYGISLMFGERFHQFIRNGNNWRGISGVLLDIDVFRDNKHPDAPEPVYSLDELFAQYPLLAQICTFILPTASSLHEERPFKVRGAVLFPSPVTDQRIYRAFASMLTAEIDCIPSNVTSNPVAVGFGNTHNAPQAWHNPSPDANWIQHALNAAEQKVLAENTATLTKRRTAEERRQAYQDRKSKSQHDGIDDSEGENISTFIEKCDPVAEMLRDGLLTSTGGTQYRWHESAHDRSCDILDGTIHIFSNTMSQVSPDAALEPVNVHRFYLYQLCGLDMTRDADKPRIREFLFERGYGSDPKAFLSTPHRVKRYKVNTEYKHNISDLDTERDKNKNELLKWLEVTEKAKGKHVIVFGSAAGTGKSTVVITTIEQFIYTAKTIGEADEIFEKLDEKGEDVMRHRSRLYNYDHPDWETLPLGLGENERACIEPLLCNEHAELLGSPNEVCARCPFYIECKDNGYLSQAEKEKNTSKVVYSWGESFICDENLASRLKRICTKDKVFILDEANPLGFTQLRKIDRGMLYDLTERFRHTLGTEHEIYQTLKTLLDLISTTEEPTDFINGVSDWITSIDDIEELDDKIGKYPVQITFHHAPSTVEHNQLFIATLRYREKVSTDVPVVDFETHETTEAFYTEEPITIESPETRFMAYGFLLKVGLASLNAPPRRYQNFLKDIKTFLNENNNLDAAPFSFDAKEQSFSFHLKPTLNHRRVIINTASDPDHLIEEAYKGTDIQITRHDGTHPVWKTNLVFQVASGAYLPRHSLIAKDGKKLKLKRYAEDMIESFIKPSLKSGLKTLVIAPKAFQEIESVRDWAVIDPDDYIPGQNAILTNHHRAEGRNDYQDCDIVFEFHYEPNHHDVQILAKHIYRNAETPLNFTREKQTVSVNGVTFEKNVYTDPRVQTIYNRECRSRLMQGPMRLRPNIHKDKIIVILTAEPIDIPITPVAFTPRDQKKFNGDWADFKKQLQATPQERIAAGESKSKAYRDSNTHTQKKKDRDAQVLALHQDGVSLRDIHSQMKEAGHKVSFGTVSNVVKAYKNSQSTIILSNSTLGKTVHPEPPDVPCVDSDSLITREPEPDHDTFFKFMDISACFYGKHQLSPSEISQLTGIDESEVRETLDDWYQAVVISPGIGEKYWMSERDTKQLWEKVLGPARTEWEKNFPGQKILCPPTAFNPNLNAIASESVGEAYLQNLLKKWESNDNPHVKKVDTEKTMLTLFDWDIKTVYLRQEEISAHTDVSKLITKYHHLKKIADDEFLRVDMTGSEITALSIVNKSHIFEFAEAS